jgi:DNA-binding HxlR family transcriptional regulator
MSARDLSSEELTAAKQTPAAGARELPITQELFALLGERWNYAILREIFFGVQRFGALQRTLGIAPNTLTARLAGLIDVGLVERHQYRPDKEWFDYRLTSSARELVPVWISVTQWAEKHLDPALKSRRQLRHTVCGEITSPQLTCSHCGESIDGHDMEPAELPAGDDA